MSSNALQPSTPSGDCLFANSPIVVFASRALLKSLTLFAAGAAATAIVYDNATTNSGTILARLNAAANTSALMDFSCPMVANAGITVALTGTGAIANVGYSAE